MLNIFDGNTYHVSISSLRDGIIIEDNENYTPEVAIKINTFLALFADDVLLMRDDIITAIKFCLTPRVFILSVDESYPFLSHLKQFLTLEFLTEQDEINENVLANSLNHSSSLNYGGMNQYHDNGEQVSLFLLKYATHFFRGVDIIDKLFDFDGRFSRRFKTHPFYNDYSKQENVQFKFFKINIAHYTDCKMTIRFDNFQISIHKDKLTFDYNNSGFYIQLQEYSMDNEINTVKDLLTYLYTRQHPSSKGTDFADFITLLKIHHI